MAAHGAPNRRLLGTLAGALVALSLVLASAAEAGVVTPHVVKPQTVNPQPVNAPSAPSPAPSPAPPASSGGTVRSPVPSAPAPSPSPSPRPPRAPVAGSGPGGRTASDDESFFDDPQIPDGPHYTDPDCVGDCQQDWYMWIKIEAGLAWLNYVEGNGSKEEWDALTEEVHAIEGEIVARGEDPDSDLNAARDLAASIEGDFADAEEAWWHSAAAAAGVAPTPSYSPTGPDFTTGGTQGTATPSKPSKPTDGAEGEEEESTDPFFGWALGSTDLTQLRDTALIGGPIALVGALAKVVAPTSARPSGTTASCFEAQPSEDVTQVCPQ